jgi:predicted glutamine amidotransferase
VAKAEYENKIELFFENGKLINWKIKKVKGRKNLKQRDLEAAIKFIRKYHEGIVNKWTDFFVKNKKVTCETISKKIWMKIILVKEANYIEGLKIEILFNDNKKTVIDFFLFFKRTHILNTINIKSLINLKNLK